jgi:uncharacterized protein YlzI (FlbEa/FlbD family)
MAVVREEVEVVAQKVGHIRHKIDRRSFLSLSIYREIP